MSGSGFCPILGIGLTDEVLPVHVGLTGVHYVVLLLLCTSDEPVIYTVLNLAPFFAFASAIVFTVP